MPRHLAALLVLASAACTSATTAGPTSTDAASADASPTDALAKNDTPAGAASDAIADVSEDSDSVALPPDVPRIADATADSAQDAGELWETDQMDAATADVGAPDLPDTTEVLDIAVDVDGVADAVDGIGTDTAGDATPPVCKDLRTLGDNKVPEDNCWAPPAHYCSGKYFQNFAFVCKPDFTACMYGSCRPCGWIGCPWDIMPNSPWPSWANAKCPKDWKEWLPGYNGQYAPLAVPYLPDPNATFCWDNAPAEWSTPEFHANEEMAPK